MTSGVKTAYTLQPPSGLSGGPPAGGCAPCPQERTKSKSVARSRERGAGAGGAGVGGGGHSVDTDYLLTPLDPGSPGLRSELGKDGLAVGF